MTKSAQILEITTVPSSLSLLLTLVRLRCSNIKDFISITSVVSNLFSLENCQTLNVLCQYVSDLSFLIKKCKMFTFFVLNSFGWLETWKLN
jgi:hypothetical protein